MIRNYYTEAFKSGIVPAISADNLIDGTAKIVQSVPSGNHNAMAATSRVVTLTAVVVGIERNMSATAPAGGGQLAWTINDAMLVESVVYTATTTIITFTTAKAIAANTVITFFSVNQSSWKEYSLFVGKSPAQGNSFGSVTSATANGAAQGQKNFTIKVSNPYIQAGMEAYDDGISLSTVATVTNSTSFVLTTDLAAAIVADSVMSFSYTALPSITVLTIDNKVVTFTQPAEGFVLPVSIVQVISVAGGLSNLIALE